ncbi:MAG: hypothetical protein MSG64_08920 [Pyrinomonadaceae bacterium MAG19_C2-C3]|nr:hypothetical protein [Pyrinomonadaceae bacterium MAG19_C2-C3]
MNYFNYFTEIEEAFIRRRGKTLLLSPIDWSLIEMWKTRGVPLHIVLGGIARSFDSHEKAARKRSVKTLLYCQEEVEAQYAEWLESQVGKAHAKDKDGAISNDETTLEAALETSAAYDESQDSHLPFPAATISAHLGEARAALENLSKEADASSVVYAETLQRAVTRLSEIETSWNAAKHHTAKSAERLESALTELEALLDEGLRADLKSDERLAHEREVAAQLAPYKARMEAKTYQATHANLVQKRVREAYRVPRLSLFYL